MAEKVSAKSSYISTSEVMYLFLLGREPVPERLKCWEPSTDHARKYATLCEMYISANKSEWMILIHLDHVLITRIGVRQGKMTESMATYLPSLL